MAEMVSNGAAISHRHLHQDLTISNIIDVMLLPGTKKIVFVSKFFATRSALRVVHAVLYLIPHVGTHQTSVIIIIVSVYGTRGCTPVSVVRLLHFQISNHKVPGSLQLYCTL